MNKHENQHGAEYVRIDTDRTAILHDLPSHRDARRGPVRGSSRWSLRGTAVAFGLTLCGVALLFGLIIVFVSQSGVVERAADNALRSIVPPGLRAQLGPTGVGLSWPPRLAVTYSDVVLQQADDAGDRVATLANLSLVIDPLSLLDDEPRIGAVELVGLDADWAALKAALDGGGSAPSGAVRLSDTPAAFDAFFEAVRDRGGVHLHHEGGVRLSVLDGRIAFAGNPLADTLTIDSLQLTASAGQGNVSGVLTLDDDVVAVSGAISVPPAGRRGTASVELTLDGLPIPMRRLPTMLSKVRSDHDPDVVHPAVATLTGLRMTHHGSDRDDNVLRVSMEPRDLAFKLDADDFVPFAGVVTLDYGFDDDVVTLIEDRWRLGRSSAAMFARIRDAGIADPGRAGTLMPIEFDAIANSGRLAPADSPARALTFAAQARGTFDPSARLFNFTDMTIETPAGEMTAEGQISLAGPLPTAVFSMQTGDLPIDVVKQLWPAPVARVARRWFLDNLAGGRLVSASFDIAEPLRRRVPGTDRRLFGDTIVDLAVEGVRFDITGDLPPVRDAVGRVRFADRTATIALEQGTVFLPSGRTAAARDGVMTIQPPTADGQVRAQVDVHVEGAADAIGEVITFRPINAKRYRDYDEAGLSGTVDAHIRLDVGLNRQVPGPAPSWDVDLAIVDGAIATPFQGRTLSGLDGTINVTPERAELDLTGRIDGLPARIDMVMPFAGSDIAAHSDIALSLGDDDLARLAPGLGTMLRGATPVRVEGEGDRVSVEADLTAAELILPWIGWSKGAGVDARAAFDLVIADGTTTLDDFRLEGVPFAATGRVDLTESGLSRARFGSLRLNEGDSIAVDVRRQGAGYAIDITGTALDARALIRHLRRQLGSGGAGEDVPVTINARIDTVRGFGGETLLNFGANVRLDAGGIRSLSLTGTTRSQMPFSVALEGQGADRQLRIEAFDAGEALRFLDVYGQVSGGVLNAALRGSDADTLSGPVLLTEFRVFSEPRLAQLANQRGRDGSQSLREAVQREIDTSDVRFDVAQGLIRISPDGLDLSEGVVRGPLVGFALQGRIADSDGNMRLTGTFMPAYGFNSLFSDIPLLGLFLGNGRDRGLIGVTFKLEGPAGQPQVSVNPLSLIAPGVFRSIFEFR